MQANEITSEVQKSYALFVDLRPSNERGQMVPAATETREQRMLYFFAHLAVKRKKDLTTNNQSHLSNAINSLTSYALAIYKESGNSLVELPEKTDMIEFSIVDQLSDISIINSGNQDSRLIEDAKLRIGIRTKTVAEVASDGNRRLFMTAQRAFKLMIEQLASPPPISTGGNPLANR